jgi:uncharacterized protein (TIGR02453 family)
MLQHATIQFLSDLQQNNHKPWFDEHRGAYVAAKNDVEQLVKSTLEILADIDPNIAGLEPKHCMFRINRDVRFSANKSPYKNNMGFAMTKGGKKSPLGGYYVHIEPGKCFFGAGIYMPMPPELKKVRQEIAYCFEEFKGIVEGDAFQRFYGGVEIDGHTLVKVPAGYAPDHRAAQYLKLKSYFASHDISDNEMCSPQLLATLAEGFRIVAPLVAFINRSLEETEE